jgi:putative SOS response-associated peptidase YedK
VVADGFYEWKKDANAKTKQPYDIRLKKDRPFAFAGLAEHWSCNGETIESCTLITTDPNELMAEIHDRMPAILPPETSGSIRSSRAKRSSCRCCARTRPTK